MKVKKTKILECSDLNKNYLRFLETESIFKEIHCSIEKISQLMQQEQEHMKFQLLFVEVVCPYILCYIKIKPFVFCLTLDH